MDMDKKRVIVENLQFALHTNTQLWRGPIIASAKLALSSVLRGGTVRGQKRAEGLAAETNAMEGYLGPALRYMW